jgi:hypothetical protein
MGRYDALTEIIEPKEPAIKPTVAAPLIQQHKPQKDGSSKAKMYTNPQTCLPTNESATLDPVEIPEKYTTHLEPSLVKRLKLYAVEKDMKDYQVIKRASLAYFNK